MEDEKKDDLSPENEEDIDDDVDVNDDESLEDEELDNDLSDEDKIVALESKNKQLFQRAKKAELKLKEDKGQNFNPSKKKKDADVPSEIDDILSLQADGYSAKEIKTLKTYSKKMSVPLSEVMNDPFIKSGINAEREKEKVESATPPPSDSINLSEEGKEFKKMDKKDREKNWGKTMDGYKNRRLKR